MILQSGKTMQDDVYESLLDSVIESIISMYASFEFEDFNEAVDFAAQSLQEDNGWLPNNENLTPEEAKEVVNRVKTPAHEFANELAQAYEKLCEKYIGTKSWELYK